MAALTKGKNTKIIIDIPTANHWLLILNIEAPKYAYTNASAK